MYFHVAKSLRREKSLEYNRKRYIDNATKNNMKFTKEKPGIALIDVTIKKKEFVDDMYITY